MTRLIDVELTQLLQEIPQDNGMLFANSKGISGEFFLEGLDITLNLSEEQLTEVEKFEDARLQYMQAYHHEYAHLYQVLALPAFQLLWASRHNYIRMQAFIMLKYFELGKSFDLETNTMLLDALKVPNLPIADDDTMKFKPIIRSYKFHIENWKNKNQQISFFEIIEGMAHIMSLQLSDTPDTDILKIEQYLEYSSAYVYFERQIETAQFETRWKYLLFLYICYFACQHINNEAQTTKDVAVKMFKFLCSRAQKYLNALKKLHHRYTDYDQQQLKELNRWPILEHDFEKVGDQKRASIYALFELIEMIEDEAKTKGLNQNLYTEALDDFYVASNNLKVDFKDIFTLARMVIFPENFYWVPELHNIVMDSSSGDNEFTYRDEAQFYHFIYRCNRLFIDSEDVLCCEEHGCIDKRRKILKCSNEGSLAFTLKKMTQRPAYDLFRC